MRMARLASTPVDDSLVTDSATFYCGYRSSVLGSQGACLEQSNGRRSFATLTRSFAAIFRIPHAPNGKPRQIW